jgi:hypothetical protein
LSTFLSQKSSNFNTPIKSFMSVGMGALNSQKTPESGWMNPSVSAWSICLTTFGAGPFF